jgi:hypothetical protein
MLNYEFYLVDEAELAKLDPGRSREPEGVLRTWAREHGAHWGNVRMRAGVLWDAIERVDLALPSDLRFHDHISRARFGPRWGTLEGVGHFSSRELRALEPALAALRARFESDDAVDELLEVTQDAAAEAARRGWALLVLRA